MSGSNRSLYSATWIKDKDDWLGVSDSQERRRIQNRRNQRTFRKKIDSTAQSGLIIQQERGGGGDLRMTSARGPLLLIRTLCLRRPAPYGCQAWQNNFMRPMKPIYPKPLYESSISSESSNPAGRVIDCLWNASKHSQLAVIYHILGHSTFFQAYRNSTS